MTVDGIIKEYGITLVKRNGVQGLHAKRVWAMKQQKNLCTNTNTR